MDFKSINKDLPDKGIQVLCYNKKWIDEEVNPQGVRIGFLCDIRGWITAQYSNCQDTYFTRESEEDNDNFKDPKCKDQEPTHWCSIKVSFL